MNAFSEKLKKEREARGITLASIAKQTRINIKYLEAIDQGAFDVLPQTYVRAFIKSYAESVGLSVQDILHQYDVVVTQKYSNPVQSEQNKLESTLAPSIEKDKIIEKEKRARLLFVFAIIIFAGTIVSLYLLNWFDSGPSTDIVKETPFQEVIKEQEAVVPKPVVVDTVDTAKVSAPLPIVQKDSLSLRIVALDSVWMTITRDSLTGRHGYLSRGRYKTYFAQNEFIISLNDAGRAKLFLNGTELKSLADSGKPVNRRKITAKYLNQ